MSPFLSGSVNSGAFMPVSSIDISPFGGLPRSFSYIIQTNASKVKDFDVPRAAPERSACGKTRSKDKKGRRVRNSCGSRARRRSVGRGRHSCCTLKRIVSVDEYPLGEESRTSSPSFMLVYIALHTEGMELRMRKNLWTSPLRSTTEDSPCSAA